MERIHREVRRKIGELGSGSRIRVSANHHRERRRIQMKQRMNVAAARSDGHRAASLEELGARHSKLTHTEVGRDRFRFLELEARVNARPFEHVESSREFVLMNIRRAFEPEQDLNIKPRIVINHDLGLPKARLRLKRLLIIEQEFPHARKRSQT